MTRSTGRSGAYGGDVYDRYRIRMLEIGVLKIIRQLLDRGMPEGP